MLHLVIPCLYSSTLPCVSPVVKACYTRPLFLCSKSYVGIESSWRYHINLGIKQINGLQQSIRKNIVTAAPSNTKLQACQVKFRQSKHKKPLLGGLAISGQGLQKILRL